jgi:hypothetical protein
MHPEQVPEWAYLLAPAMHLYFLVGRANLAVDSPIGVPKCCNMSVMNAPVVSTSLGPVYHFATNLDWPFHLMEEVQEVMAVLAQPPAALC